MPRRSPFQIRVTEEARRELEAITRKYTSPYRDVIRARIIRLAAQGYPNDVIAQRLEMRRQIMGEDLRAGVVG